jgi:hypothetical protein
MARSSARSLWLVTACFAGWACCCRWPSGLASWREEPSFEQQICASFAQPDRALADRLQQKPGVAHGCAAATTATGSEQRARLEDSDNFFAAQRCLRVARLPCDRATPAACPLAGGNLSGRGIAPTVRRWSSSTRTTSPGVGSPITSASRVGRRAKAQPAQPAASSASSRRGYSTHADIHITRLAVEREESRGPFHSVDLRMTSVRTAAMSDALFGR